jgi:hypothetical protein
MLPRLPFHDDLPSREPIPFSIPRQLSKCRVKPDLNGKPSRRRDSVGLRSVGLHATADGTNFLF